MRIGCERAYVFMTTSKKSAKAELSSWSFFQETAQIKESKSADNAEMTDAMSDEDFKSFMKLARFVVIVILINFVDFTQF